MLVASSVGGQISAIIDFTHLVRQLSIYYSFTIFVVEQEGGGTFNKGRLMNTGFEFAAKLGRDAGMPYDCFIFQDVDLLVEHDTLLYRWAAHIGD